jgi:hypothetical protein
MERQAEFISEHRSFIEFLAATYAPAFEGYLGMREECRLHYDDPHPKRDLRIHAYEELIDSGQFHQRLWLRNVTYKLKKDELAKNGKYPRMIGDLGVAASLQGFRLTYFLKTAQEQTIFINGGHIEFMKKPSTEGLTHVFDSLISPVGRFYFVCFSDDSCFSIRHEGRVHIYNVDISSCDASHTKSLFDAFVDLHPLHVKDDARILAEQCALPIKVYDLTSRKRYVKLLPKYPRLYSGSTITTAINNLASMLIAYSFSLLDVPTPENVIAAAASVGYVITLEHCRRYEDIQFLKHSPVLTSQGYKPLLNLGVLLRSTGVCRGDLPGKGDLETRARAFQHNLLLGMYPRSRFTLIDAMKSISKGSTVSASVQRQIDRQIEQTLAYKVGEGEETLLFEDSNVYVRYGLSDSDIRFLNTDFANSSFGDHSHHPALSSILTKDYDLTCE